MQFICDDNLGKLAKYLRILGFDALFTEPISDPDLLRIASAQNRYLLTRDHQLLNYSHPFGILLLENDDPLMQLTVVIKTLNLSIDPGLLFQRCSRCNEITHPIDKAAAQNHLFPYIIKTQGEIKQCHSCGRYYWKGTHYKRLLEELRTAIPDNLLAGPWPPK